MDRLQTSDADRARWAADRRGDILARVDAMGMWLTVEGRTACPFLAESSSGGTFHCTIYDTRPEVCREYPLAVAHMKFVDCDMLDADDTDADVQRYMLTDAAVPTAF